MNTLEFKWTISRGRDTYGYNICSLYLDGRKVAACNGGGYDMKGTSLGNFIARAYADRLRALTPEQMPEQSHWESDRKKRCGGQCYETYTAALLDAIERDQEEAFEKSVKLELYDRDTDKCPHCGADTFWGPDAGKRINDGRYFYGLTFHDPNFDPGKAVIGEGCTDRTLARSIDGESQEGKTVEQAEAEGASFGLERYQAFYTASSKIPTERHTVPLIDGGCGFSSVEKIMEAIGLTLEGVRTRSRKSDIYILHDSRKEVKQ